MILSNIKLNYPSAREWMWNYCLYLGPYTSSQGNKYDLGAHYDGNCWSAAIVFGDEPGDYLSGDFDIPRNSSRKEIYTEVESRLENLNLLPSKKITLLPLRSNYYGTKFSVEDKFNTHTFRFWIADLSPPTTRALQTWDSNLTFEDYLNDREMSNLDTKETGTLSMLFDLSGSHYENISTLEGILKIEKYLSLPKAKLDINFLDNLNSMEPKQFIRWIDIRYYRLAGEDLSICETLY